MIDLAKQVRFIMNAIDIIKRIYKQSNKEWDGSIFYDDGKIFKW